jgi:hypothetical protein
LISERPVRLGSAPDSDRYSNGPLGLNPQSSGWHHPLGADQRSHAAHVDRRGQLYQAGIRPNDADLCWLPVDTELQLSQPEAASGPSPEAEAALKEALAHNPEIESAAHQVEKARAALLAGRAEYIPEVGAFAQYIYQDGAPFLTRNNGAFFGAHEKRCASV